MFEILSLIYKYKLALLEGLYTTFKLVGIAWITGISMGLLIGIILYYYFKFIGKVISIFSFILITIPVLVILYWLHYPLQYILGIVIDPFITSLIVLCVFNILSVAKIVIDNKNNIPRQFYEVAITHGIREYIYFWRIEVPMIIKYSLGSIIYAQMNVLHMSLFAGLISVDEIFRTILRINAIEYRPVELFTILALTFFIFSLPLALLSIFLKKKYDINFSER